MPENLLSPTEIKLFGRVLAGVVLDHSTPSVLPKELGGNNFLRKQLDQKDARLARIYAIAYEGTFYNLPKPAIYLVHGDGGDIETVDQSGVIAKNFTFERGSAKPATGKGAGATLDGVRVWQYDKADMTLRLDVMSGTFEEVLLDAALSASSAYALTSRTDLAARTDLASRTDLAARTDLASRTDLTARHRLGS